jgi:hypothetical protein
MYRYAKSAFALIVAFIPLLICVSTAEAQCQHSGTGTVGCPLYVAPATTAVPGRAVDGSAAVPGNVSTMLFNGAVPPNGFLVQLGIAGGYRCWVNDNGPANVNSGFMLDGTPGSEITFVTPAAYRPMGPVSIFCEVSVGIFARGW